MTLARVFKTPALIERMFPERRIFLRSDDDTRFIRLKSGSQFVAVVGVGTLVGWAFVATAVLVMQSLGAGSFRDQAARDLAMYQARLNELALERDSRTSEALAAQNRFNAAVNQISTMQTELLNAETRVHELESGLESTQVKLSKAAQIRDEMRTELVALRQGTAPLAVAGGSDDTLDLMARALERTAAERDMIVADAQSALVRADEMALELRLMEEKNDRIFRQLEDAMTISVGPLNKMFKAVGLDSERIIGQIQRGYSGQGGPLTPLMLSTQGQAPSADVARANRILENMDRMNLYRIATQKVPFAEPLQAPYRFTSGFGRRWGRMHEGADFAAAHGTRINTTADGVVTFAGWSSGYGMLVKIQHEFGFETRYAHLSKIRVKVGQRVSRGDRIGAMGNTGRSTGTHLHYEVRVGGKAVNPMNFIRAANDVL